MKITIPNSAFLGNINTFFSKLDLSEPDKLEIITHPNWIAIHPVVVAMVAALGKSLQPKKITCNDITAPSGHYLKVTGLFDFLGIKPKVKAITEHELSGKLIPLKQIKDSNDLDFFLKELVPLLHLDREPKHAQAIQHIFSELIRNVLEHANSKSGAIVCAQYFQTSNRISIGVVDAGVGLKATLSQSYAVKDDLEAIKLALTPGVTGTTRKPGGTEQNAGFGLFLIKSIAYVNSDFFVIASGNHMYKLLKRNQNTLKLKSNPLKDRHTKIEIPYWNGVAVGIDISLNQTQEFTYLMDEIHIFYSKEVRGQKRKRYKKPTFI